MSLLCQACAPCQRHILHRHMYGWFSHWNANVCRIYRGIHVSMESHWHCQWFYRNFRIFHSPSRRFSRQRSPHVASTASELSDRRTHQVRCQRAERFGCIKGLSWVLDMEVSIVMGVTAGWFVIVMENPSINGWFGGSHIWGNLHMSWYEAFKGSWGYHFSSKFLIGMFHKLSFLGLTTRKAPNMCASSSLFYSRTAQFSDSKALDKT